MKERNTNFLLLLSKITFLYSEGEFENREQRIFFDRGGAKEWLHLAELRTLFNKSNVMPRLFGNDSPSGEWRQICQMALGGC